MWINSRRRVAERESAANCTPREVVLDPGPPKYLGWYGVARAVLEILVSSGRHFVPDIVKSFPHVRIGARGCRPRNKFAITRLWSRAIIGPIGFRMERRAGLVAS